MSIASEITRLSSAKAALKDAIVAKGVEVADSLKLDGYAEKVAAIPSGGGEWTPPDEWRDASGNKIDLRKIVSEAVNPDPSVYTNCIGVLLAPSDGGYTNIRGVAYAYITNENGERITTPSWNPPIGYHVLLYWTGESYLKSIGFGARLAKGMWYLVGLANLWVVAKNQLTVSAGYQEMFCDNFYLQAVENMSVELVSCGTVGSASYCGFVNDSCLVSLTNCNLSYSDGAGSVQSNNFWGCYKLKDIGVVDCSMSEFAITSFAGQCYCLEKYPFVVPNKTSASAQTFPVYGRNIPSRELAVFNESGEIIDGIAAFKARDGKSMDATGAAGTRTYRILNPNTYIGFTDDQVSAIVAAFANHGWTLTIG